jgi:hypothetical protein
MNYLGILKAGLSTIYRLGLTDINYMWLLDGRTSQNGLRLPPDFVIFGLKVLPRVFLQAAIPLFRLDKK